ncbi:transcriptional regulator, LysR family [Catenulispora acidiphila DSM 44928]|uniref:Transcriptional regulator, LysR family n=1 Tax=Catenulispora acidiphila (strain DSM 44928 / JCM 14897 / NBRC 102108 / NRRL B-24433 / ID139908) TaxID=479433 RepID=C7Q4U3_CATAD|nr:LysR substrate-binding domain-containing protein [Catenulispora acidiphila]ACU73891.1 transcriptional regulator, LysR family [Catenulispora acidiphila DSM 44928]
MDVDLRKLRYFLAVADELHFGRAAERLHIAQPVLSRQIRVLEGELGTELFLRDRRHTVLTPAGEQLVQDAKQLLANADALQRRVRAAGQGVTRLTIGFMPGITVTPVISRLRAHHPDLDVRMLRTGWHDQVEVLHDARADIGIVRLPINQTGLELRPLYTEPRLAILPTTHPLAAKHTIHITDLAADHLLQDPDAIPEWRDIAKELRTGAHRPAPTINSVEEKLELVAGGQGIAVIPASTAAFYTRPDIAAIPIDDLSPNHVAAAWPTDRTTPLIEEFVEAATELLPGS